MLTARELAARLGMSRGAVVQYAKDGILHGVKSGPSLLAKYHFPESEVERYQRERRPRGAGSHRATVDERFWHQVRKGEGDACWEWDGLNNRGYGLIRSNGQRFYAHRFSWIQAHGPIPDGLFVLHRCDNPPCVRPSHLFLGTKKDNARDMILKGRGPAAAKLSDDQVRELRALATWGMKYWLLGKRYGLSTRNIARIVRGETYSHVT